MANSSLAARSKGKGLAEGRCPESEEPADKAEVPMRSENQRSRGQAEESKPGEHTDARDNEAEHVVRGTW